MSESDASQDPDVDSGGESAGGSRDREYISLSQFNEEASEKAYQRQVREEAAERYEGKEWWDDADLDLSNAWVRETTRDVAKKIILEYEWLGTLPSFASRHYGIFFDDWACGGVCCYADAGAGGDQHKLFDVERDELAYLCRGAVVHWAPENTNSKLIAYSLDLEREKGKKVAVAYSDPDAGEIGTVYQATGWYCIGQTGSLYQYVHPETGRVYDMKIVDQLLRQNDLKDEWSWSDMRDYLVDERGWTEKRSKPKYRYMKILTDDDAERRRIYAAVEDEIIGYPKRERDVFDEPP